MTKILLSILVLFSAPTFAEIEANKLLFESLSTAAQSDCGMGKCYVVVRGLKCQKNVASKTASCAFTDSYDDKKIQVTGDGATNLFDAIVNAGIPAEGAAGTHYVGARKLSCVVVHHLNEFRCHASLDLPLVH